MVEVREVAIEIIRHGPAHNQLLSPTTQYLALCGAHEAVTLNIPAEHHKVVHWLSRMGEREFEDQGYHYEREELRNLVTSLLEQLPALSNESQTDIESLVHLRLIITAQELSLLPFELAHPPAGLARSRQPLLMGPEPNVLLTREVRRSERVQPEIPDNFRLLVVASDPYERGLPLADTLAEFEAVLSPFAHPVNRGGELMPDYSGLIDILNNASLDEVYEHCNQHNYSHVHFLAHGSLLPGRCDAYGMVLWDKSKQNAEVVDGEALARVLSPPREDTGRFQPWCVTLATCDSSHQESIPLVPQTSLAHALHEIGIPTVIASQYPLTFGAAIEMARCLYRGELAGSDIRYTLRSLRHRVGSRMRQTMDWGSLAIYAAWPENLSGQTDALRACRRVQRLEAANAWADAAIPLFEVPPCETGGYTVAAGEAARVRLKDIVPELEQGIDYLNRVAREGQYRASRRERHWINPRHRQDVCQAGNRVLRVEYCGLLGSALKRQARLCHELAAYCSGESCNAEQILGAAASWYGRGADGDSASHWNACQAFVLRALSLNRCVDGQIEKDNTVWKNARRYWNQAQQSANIALLRKDSGPSWAHSTLIEVELWRPLFDGEQGKPERHVDALVESDPGDSFALISTRRQLERYVRWWQPASYACGVDEELADRVLCLLKRFPDGRSSNEQLPDIAARSPFDVALDSVPCSPDGNQPLGGETIHRQYFEQMLPEEVGLPFFRVQMLPARGGDALWIEYGQGEKTHRILIDGGYRSTIKSIEHRVREIALAEGGHCDFELVVVTHIDADHIEGIVEFLGAGLPIRIGELWFNGRRHHPHPHPHPHFPSPAKLRVNDELGGKHGLFLDNLIELLDTPWNKAFGGEAVMLPAGKEAPAMITLAGGMKITLLSPTREKLAALAPHWDKEVKKAGLDQASVAAVLAAMERLHYRTEGAREAQRLRDKPLGPINMAKLLAAPDSEDGGEANGASIAFLLEFDGRSILCTGDAHAEVLIEGISRLVGEQQRLAVGAVKLPHHGSRNNISQALLNRLATDTFLISTSGARHYHPDREAIARLVAGDWRNESDNRPPIRLMFNYPTPYTRVWDNEALKAEHQYEVFYPCDRCVMELSAVPRSGE